MESAPPSYDNSKTLIEVRLCDWHMRCIFWNHRIWEKYYTYELDILLEQPLRERINPTSDAKGKYNQDWLFVDPNRGDEQVARCHTFVEADGVTIAASGLPDPKHITLKGYDYHQTKKGGIPCEHCAKALSSYPTGDPDPMA
jgi:hypothetical protein